MEEVQHCCVCLELYNSSSRKPLLLPCRHHLCSLCLSTQAILVCPLCRNHIAVKGTALPVDEQLLLAIGSRNRMPSPSSFPIGGFPRVIVVVVIHADISTITSPHTDQRGEKSVTASNLLLQVCWQRTRQMMHQAHLPTLLLQLLLR